MTHRLHSRRRIETNPVGYLVYGVLALALNESENTLERAEDMTTSASVRRTRGAILPGGHPLEAATYPGASAGDYSSTWSRVQQLLPGRENCAMDPAGIVNRWVRVRDLTTGKTIPEPAVGTANSPGGSSDDFLPTNSRHSAAPAPFDGDSRRHAACRNRCRQPRATIRNDGQLLESTLGRA